MTLWDIALENAKSKESSVSQQESHVLFLGSKSAGKTTLINRLLEKDESPKPTVALEYTFGRKSKGHASNKEVAHVWELGGGFSMTRLLDMVIDADNVLNCSVVLLVDLSQPGTIWSAVEALTAAVVACVGRVIASAPKESRLKEQLRQKQKDRLQNVEADDAQLMTPFPLPLTIVGGKFDQFQEKVDHERKRVATQTLRFLAHSYNASLYFFSTVKQEQAASRLRSHLTQLAFGSGGHHPHQDEVQADVGRPIILPAGRDSFAKIGQPPADDGDYNRLSAKTPLDLWKHVFYQHFPEERHQFSGGRHPVPENPTVDPNDPHKFDEPAVDRARAAKDEELEKYKRISDRKMRDLMQQAVNEGINVSFARQLE
ncbi:hypothetical protein BOX15_Mlig014805g2 [Macrostomum lignano]|uniref:Cytoplasmic dynein 2 light intermediate chain 1 n=2 Tax=Macrostomum lignano TaxID=282301 RepID=A0A1I8GSI4_9PLAT|nr:hypothetical protein BOX15_Mlig014805g2 [Macrostomum lignano]